MSKLFDEITKQPNSMALAMLVASEYNSRRGFFQRKVTALEVDLIINPHQPSNADLKAGISPAEIIAIAKLACQVVTILNNTVCPIISSM